MNYKLNQNAGGYFATLHKDKNKEKRIWFMAQLNTASYAAQVLQTNKDILLNKKDDMRFLHLTLLTMHFNLNAPEEVLNIILPNGQLHPRITAMVNMAYNNTFRAAKPVLFQVPSVYFMMNSFMAKVMVMRDKEQIIITHFRMQIYAEITKLFEENGYTIKKPFDTTTDPEYTIVSVFKGASAPIPIYAIPAYDYGTGNWSPHISIGNILDIKDKNTELFRKFEKKVQERAIDPRDFAGKKIEKFKLPTLSGLKLPIYRWAGTDLYHIAKLYDPEDMTINMDRDIVRVIVDND